MVKRKSVWTPRYTLTPAIARGLMEIEATRAEVERAPLSLAMQVELRRKARVRATHYSTRIEGNRLTLAETEQVLQDKKARFHGRERDVREVQNYWNALVRVEEWAARKLPLTEDVIRRLHALVQKGSRAKPTPYRDGQNVIRDTESGDLIYMPPEAKDVPDHVAALVAWVNHAEREKLPVPVIAGLAHYQFVTVHPYYDGNGRTARLLATFLLHRGGYGLKGYFSLEEHHARDLPAYYRALAVHPHHNYYEGRANADLTGWLEYFMKTLASVYAEIKDEVTRHPVRPDLATMDTEPMRRLDPRARIVVGIFVSQAEITSGDVASALSLSQRMARVLLNQWVEQGWLKVADPSNRNRAYVLSAKYRQLIGNVSHQGQAK